MLGAHLRRYNASRVSQVAALQRCHGLKCAIHDESNPEHAGLLKRLWVCGFGAERPFEMPSERWVHLGFQCEDPRKDFRGMGVLGLSNLVYFGEQYSEVSP